MEGNWAPGYYYVLFEDPDHESIAASGETGQPVLDVGGVARLRHLAVVDEIDARVDLFLYHLGNGRADPGRQCGAVDRHPFLLGKHRPDQIIRPRQAAGVGLRPERLFFNATLRTAAMRVCRRC
jgi:hypothetical protein